MPDLVACETAFSAVFTVDPAVLSTSPLLAADLHVTGTKREEWGEKGEKVSEGGEGAGRRGRWEEGTMTKACV